jgi:hypothetical protein
MSTIFELLKKEKRAQKSYISEYKYSIIIVICISRCYKSEVTYRIYESIPLERKYSITVVI